MVASRLRLSGAAVSCDGLERSLESSRAVQGGVPPVLCTETGSAESATRYFRLMLLGYFEG